jgi:hypothetical protein
MHRVLFDEGHPIPRALEHLLEEAGCPAGAPLTDQRAALEALAAAQPERIGELDPHLLHLRELETAGEGLPRTIDGVRRDRLVAYDPFTTTWTGWREDGGRGAVRCLRPRWRRDPVVHRRIELGLRRAATLRGLAPMSFHPHGDWPHVAYRLPGLPLAELLPAEDPPDPVAFGRWLGLGLETLQALHERGLRAGDTGPLNILLAERRAYLLWLDPVGPGERGVASDIRGYVGSLLRLMPLEGHPLTQLAMPWATDPPASAEEASSLLRRALADHLVAARHALAMRGRSAGRGERAVQLYAIARQLLRVTPPPVGRCCLRAGHDRVLHLVESDGQSVRGGAAAGVPPFGLMPLFTPNKGLDAPATRAMLRAWARREDGDLELRASAQERWEGSEEAGQALVRWLSAASRLRREQLMLAVRLRR